MKLLYITSLSGKRLNRFMISAIVAAKSLGFSFEMACNMDGADIEGYNLDCQKYGIKAHNISFCRNPLSLKNLKAFRQLNNLISKGGYDAVHCNTPIGGILGRLCAKNKVKKIIYQAHGFHFWKGAPLKNWLFFYPVEKILARQTDYFLTINDEDYQRSRKFKIKNDGVCYHIHGVGIGQIATISETEKNRLRESLNVPNDCKIFLSVGEINKNKNHKLALNALSQMTNEKFLYLICGEGKLKRKLEKKAVQLNIYDKVRFLGFRSDVDQLLQIADVFVFPSIREGLPISLMEAIQCKLPCVASKIRGNVDLLPNSQLLFSPRKPNELLEMLRKTEDASLCLKEIELNKATIQLYLFDNVVKELKKVYLTMANSLNENK